MKILLKPAHSIKPHSGFTLLEVMVALAIFAVAAVALMKVGMSYTQNVGQMKDRTYAHFIAMNELAQLEISGSWPEGTSERKIDEQGRQWQVSYEAFNTMSEEVKRVEIQVAPIPAGQDKALTPVTHLSAFLQRPVAQSN